MQQTEQLSRSLSSTPSTLPSVEYTIYAYNNYEAEKVGYNRWQRLSSSFEESVALTKAEYLFGLQKYQKVEVKKKKFDERKGSYTVSTHKVFESKPRSVLFTYMVLGLIPLILLGLAYLVVTGNFTLLQ